MTCPGARRLTTVSIGHKERFEGLEADGIVVISTGEGRREEILRRNPQTFGDPFTSRGSDSILAAHSSKHEADKGRLQNTWGALLDPRGCDIVTNLCDRKTVHRLAWACCGNDAM